MRALSYPAATISRHRFRARLRAWPATLMLTEAAERVGVSTGTLKRWASGGLIPSLTGAKGEEWTPATVAHARVVHRLRERGHTLDEIRQATAEGRLAHGFLEEIFPDAPEHARAIDEVAEETGLEPALIERFWASLGLPAQGLENLTDEDVQALQYAASVLAAGFPLVAFLQIARVYGQALAQIADAEVRLFHIYVHEPLIREGVPEHSDGRGDGATSRATCCRSPRR